MGHSILAWIVIGVIAGWVTGKLMKGSGFGFIMDMVIGLVGALIGGWISGMLGFGTTGQHGMKIGSIIIAVIGALSRSPSLFASSLETDRQIFSTGPFNARIPIPSCGGRCGLSAAWQRFIAGRPLQLKSARFAWVGKFPSSCSR